ncbi:hypothetical protein SE15_11220 [Thermanaerothrix daxensis]|uniref:Phage tail tape measure protein n=1 Tax=Thermanaerothrix daxensis TaxID=869279 RepID=A0A0P6XGQ8_9CHLR|nr:hypothetical protein [Thermanaerothrix daxensis]KPL82660.1 hypothetical protein SE15_11220 [Thermanaerothrix daxensis]
MDEKQLRLLLIFGSDAAKVNDDMKKVQSRVEELQRRVKALQETMKLNKAVGKDINELERELEDVTRELVELDQQARKAEVAMRGMANSSRDIRDNLFNLRDIGEKLNQVGGAFQRFGRSILSPIFGSAQAYISTSPFSTAAMAWQKAQNDIQQSFLRIGAVATEQLLPALRIAAELVNKIADVIERNPELVKAAVLIGGGFAAIGGLTQIVGQITMLVGVVKALNLPAILGGVGGAVSRLGLLNPYVAVTAAVGATAAAGYSALARTEFGAQRNLQAAPAQLATILGYYAGRLFSEDRAREWALAVGRLTGAINDHITAVQRDTVVTQQQLEAYEAYEQAQRQRVMVEQQYQVERSRIIAEFANQRLEVERRYEASRNALIAQYAEQRRKIMQAYAQAERQAEQDYYQNRLKVARSYQVEVQRAEEDHQRRLRQLQTEHEDRLQELIDARDALGIIREQRSYERRRQEEEEQYRIQAARRSEDFARQISEMEAQFAVQRQRRREEFQIQMQELSKQHQLRMAQLAAERAEELKRLNESQKARLRQLDQQYQNELQQLRAAEQNRLNILRALALNDQAALQQAGMQLTLRYKEWLNQQVQSFLGTKSPPRGRALGGPVMAGIPYVVGEQGPELFIPESNGSIVPNSLTKNLLTSSFTSTGKVIQMHIETSTLTLKQVMHEVEKLLSRRDRALIDAFGG